MSATSPSERVAREHAFASVYRALLGGGAEAKFGRFTLLRPLGRGAQGRVYAAFDPTLEREVALKLMAADSPGAIERGLAEGRALARLRHPNLVQIHDVVQQDGVIALAMERVDGPTLRQWLCDRPTPAEIVETLLAIARGFSALHTAGLTHRDLKPANVVVDRELGPRIVDLGLAREADAAPTGRLRSGTPEYRAPEQRDGVNVGPAADQYAWAVVAWEALSGTRPADAGAVASGIPRGLVAILRRALEQDPARRFPSMAALLDAVQQQRRSTRRRRTALAAVLGAAMLLAWQWAIGPGYVCEPDPSLANAWDEERSHRLRERLAGLAGSTADELAAHIADELDTDHLALLQTSQWVCEEERQGRARADERFCVSQAAAEFDVVVHALSRLDAAALADGADLVARMPPVDACRRDPAARPIQANAHDLAELARVRGTLQGIGSACGTMSVDACRRRFDELTVAVAPGDCTIAPIADFERGRGLLLAGDDAGAYEHLSTAAWAAESCGLANVELAAKRYCAGLTARRAELEQARWWLASARAAFGRLPDAGRRRGELELTRGIVLALEGDPRRSVEALQEAVALLEPQRDAASETLTMAYVNLGQSAREAGAYARAVSSIEAGLELQRARSGPNHPEVGRTLNSLAIARHEAGDPAAAERTLAAAIALFEAWGDRYPNDLADALGNLGSMRRAAGRLDEAEAAYRRSLELRKTFGGGEAATIGTLHNLANLDAMRGDLEGAASQLRDALHLAAQAWGEGHPQADTIAVSLGNVRLKQLRFDDAYAVSCPAAHRIRERLGNDHRQTIQAAAVCATAMVSRGDHAGVVEGFGGVLAGSAELPGNDRAALRFALAQSKWNLGERGEGLAMAERAAQELAGDEAGRAEVVAWIDAATTGRDRG
jgi:tetratricopeptide (TPR) repeat protein